MLKILTIGGWMLILPFLAKGQFHDSEVEKVLLLMEKQQLAWNRGDVEGFMEVYWVSDSLQFIGKGGVVLGWQQTLARYKKNYPNQEAMGVLTFTTVSVKKIAGDHIFLIGKWILKRKEDSPSGYFSLLWKKINGQWVIVADHSS